MATLITQITFSGSVFTPHGEDWFWELVAFDDNGTDIKIEILNRTKFESKKDCRNDLDDYIIQNNLQVNMIDP